VFVYTPATGEKHEYRFDNSGINIAPAWSPDGRYLAVTLSFDRNPDLYIIDLATESKRRLTTDSGIDTSPTWSPDGQWIAFTSDRGGAPQIYRVAAAGGEPQRLTFQGKQNLKPVYSPDGTKLAFVNDDGGSLRIALMDLKTSQLKFLTDGPIDDGPTFAPSGTILMYERIGGGGGTALATVTTDGLIKRDVRGHDSEVREPAWSTYVQ
jgi:TolB protein